MKYYCYECQKYVENPKIPRCPDCSNVYDIQYKYDNFSHIFKQLRDKKIWHWKYRSFMPINYHNLNVISMGEGGTPLIESKHLEIDGVYPLYFKCEFTNPTGSFKDRASALEVTLAGRKDIVVATTGNMGSSLAAYAAFAGIKCKVFIPDNISSNKLEQMKFYGAEIITIKGNYIDAMEYCEKYYLNNPNTYLAGDYGIRVEGTKSVGFEIWDQLDGDIPNYIIVPVGNGTLLHAIWKAFNDLKEIGLINVKPKIIGVKSDNPETTLVSSIAVTKPNADYVVNTFSHEVIKVSDNEIMSARKIMGQHGIFVEPGGATAYAGLRKSGITGTIVVIATGSGLKGV